MSRKLLITIIVGLIIVFGVSLWFFFFRSEPVTTVSTAPTAGLPFGQGGDNTPLGSGFGESSAETGVSVGLNASGKPVSKLFRITEQPVAGMVSFNKNKIPVVRFVERATGHVYDVDPTTLEKIKITNNTHPKIQEAYFKNDGSGVLLRSIKEGSDAVENISLSLTAPKATTTDTLYEVKTTFINGNLGDISVGPNNSLVFVLEDTGSVATSLFDGTKGVNLFTSAFTDWEVLWPTTNAVILTTKANSGVSGYSYSLNTTSGALSKNLGPHDALTTLGSPDGRNIAYSYSSKGKTVFAYKNLIDKSGYEILPSTFVDKCVWSKSEVGVLYCGTPSTNIGQKEPESWYKGLSHFSDQIWRFNLQTNTSEVLAEPKKDYGLNTDTTHLTLSPDEDYLFFINKNDLSLWALKLR
jgi:hypothetical protein